MAKSTLDEQKALNSLLGAIDPAKAAMSKLDTQVEQLGKHLDAGRISQDQYNSSLSKIDKDYAKLEKTATGFDKLRLGTRQAQENVVQLGNALSSGDWGSGVRAVAQLGAGAGASAASLLTILAPIALITNAFSSMEDAVVNFAMTGKLSFADFAKSILADMARIATRQASSSALSGLFGLAASAAGSYFGGASSAGSTQGGYTGSDFSNWSAAQANGGAWSGGVQMFANGGVFTDSIVSKPTAFGMAGGKTGVMGEAGPEAIVPLARDSQGRLGVRGGTDTEATQFWW